MDLNETACIIIAYAGDSRSNSTAAVRAAKEGEYEKAERLLAEAEESLLAAHNTHTKILTMEANASKVEINFLVVHAADHLTAAELGVDMAKMCLDIVKEMRGKHV